MKKALVLVLTLSLLLALSAPAFAGAETTVLSNQDLLNVNGNSVKLRESTTSTASTTSSCATSPTASSRDGRPVQRDL
jgi:hypothetical protein